MSPGIKALKGFRLVFKLHKRNKNIQQIWKLGLKVMAETYDYCHSRLIFNRFMQLRKKISKTYQKLLDKKVRKND